MATRRLCFFQAEDGIRDSPWSRGLGDVYKKLLHAYVVVRVSRLGRGRRVGAPLGAEAAVPHGPGARRDRDGAGRAERARASSASSATPSFGGVLACGGALVRPEGVTVRAVGMRHGQAAEALA